MSLGGYAPLTRIARASGPPDRAQLALTYSGIWTSVRLETEPPDDVATAQAPDKLTIVHYWELSHVAACEAPEGASCILVYADCLGLSSRSHHLANRGVAPRITRDAVDVLQCHHSHEFPILHDGKCVLVSLHDVVVYQLIDRDGR